MSNINQPPAPANAAVNSAQQSIAQSTAIALADATDNLRNLNTLSTTAIGVALSQYIETGDTKFSSIIHEAQQIVTRGTDNFSAVGDQINNVLHHQSES